MGRPESRKRRATSSSSAFLESSTCKLKQEPIDDTDYNIDLYSLSSFNSPQSSICSSDLPPVKPKRIRQCLDHLTREEKTLRRKMKNRVAAQSARDRKKALFDDMKAQMDRLSKEKAELIAYNQTLKQKNDQLTAENLALKDALLKPKVETEGEANGSVNSAAVINARQQRGQVPLAQSEVFLVVSTLLMLTIYQLLATVNPRHRSTSRPAMKSVKDFSTHSSPRTYQATVQHLKPPLVPPWWGCHQSNWSPVKVNSLLTVCTA